MRASYLTAMTKFLPVVCPHGGGKNCPTCVAMCENRPCWGTPEDAKKLIAAGYCDRLMDDYWVGGGGDDGMDDIHLISPAIVGYEGEQAPLIPRGRCTFLTKDGLCELHTLNLKPTEGSVANCQTDGEDDLHKKVSQTWNSEEAQHVVEKWRLLTQAINF